MSKTDKTRPWWVKQKDDKLAYDYHPFADETGRWPK